MDFLLQVSSLWPPLVVGIALTAATGLLRSSASLLKSIENGFVGELVCIELVEDVVLLVVPRVNGEEVVAALFKLETETVDFSFEFLNNKLKSILFESFDMGSAAAAGFGCCFSVMDDFGKSFVLDSLELLDNVLEFSGVASFSSTS